ncbi:hypothetical protein THAOC_35522, partial [Thalassiosira oceanica]
RTPSGRDRAAATEEPEASRTAPGGGRRPGASPWRRRPRGTGRGGKGPRNTRREALPAVGAGQGPPGRTSLGPAYHGGQSLVVRIKYRFQKNGDNGEETDFARDTSNPRFCPVLAAWCIHARAVRLKVPKGSPIAVYGHKGSHTKALAVGTHLRPREAHEAVTC